jgi:hypothetical protein
MKQHVSYRNDGYIGSLFCRIYRHLEGPIVVLWLFVIGLSIFLLLNNLTYMRRLDKERIVFHQKIVKHFPQGFDYALPCPGPCFTGFPKLYQGIRIIKAGPHIQ